MLLDEHIPVGLRFCFQTVEVETEQTLPTGGRNKRTGSVGDGSGGKVLEHAPGIVQGIKLAVERLGAFGGGDRGHSR